MFTLRVCGAPRRLRRRARPPGSSHRRPGIDARGPARKSAWPQLTGAPASPLTSPTDAVDAAPQGFPVAKAGERKAKGRRARPAWSLSRLMTLLAAIAVVASSSPCPTTSAGSPRSFRRRRRTQATFGPPPSSARKATTVRRRRRATASRVAATPAARSASSLRRRFCSKRRRRPCPSVWRSSTERRRPTRFPASAARRDPLRPAQSPPFFA